MLKPMFPAFNAATLHMARLTNPRGWSVSRSAPSSLTSLKARSKRDGIITVSSLNSERTIYGDLEVSLAARAWHDACHLLADACFDDAGERAVCAFQQSQLATVYGDAPSLLFRHIIEAEVIGQLEYKAQFGGFPANQRGFVLDYLAKTLPREFDGVYMYAYANQSVHFA